MILSAILYLMISYGCVSEINKMNNLSILMTLIFFTIVQDMFNAALPAFMVSKFPVVLRGKGLAISYNTGLTLFGGFIPYLILTHGNTLTSGIVISICAVMTLGGLYFSKEMKNVYLFHHDS